MSTAITALSSHQGGTDLLGNVARDTEFPESKREDCQDRQATGPPEGGGMTPPTVNA